MQPLIFDIARGSTVDGDGIRTVVFFKGCRLRCDWCHNPESRSRSWGLFYHGKKCIGCGGCASVCGRNAITIDRQKGIILSKDDCNFCGKCSDACVCGALEGIGRYYTPGRLCRILMEDKSFYEASGGGVTFSGGEPLLHAAYIGEIAEELYGEGVSVAFETAGDFEYGAFEKWLRQYTDFVLYDLKLMDESLHKKHTKAGNRKILDNFDRLCKDGVRIIPRTPCIPGITDTDENLGQIRDFLKQYGLEKQHVLLPFHEGGEKKKAALLL